MNFFTMSRNSQQQSSYQDLCKYQFARSEMATYTLQHTKIHEEILFGSHENRVAGK